MEEIKYKKMNIKNTEDFIYLEKLLSPVKRYVEEKKINGMYDDYDEYKNTIQWIENIKNIILNEEDVLTAYYIENSENDIVGIIFALTENEIIKKFREKHNIKVDDCKQCQLICFHIDKQYRGIGKKFLENYVFKDLKDKKINIIFIKSSHNKALSLYSKFGNVVGNYIGISENQLYQRYGYIYKIQL